MQKNDYHLKRIMHWDEVGKNYFSNIFTRGYHSRLIEIYSNLIPPGVKILEIGCGNGDFLSSLKPGIGVGIDFSSIKIDQAKNRHTELIFYCTDVTQMSTVLKDEKFDFIILSDLINDLWDVQAAFQSISQYCSRRTRLVINYYSHLWQPILSIAQTLGLATPTLQQNWLTSEDLKNIMHLSGFEVIKNWVEILLPLQIPLLASFVNKFLVKIWGFNQLALTNFMIARPISYQKERDYSVSVIVPARNEAGNIENILKRMPEMGISTEIIFVEGNSTDKTYLIIEELLPKYPQRKIILIKQDEKGKGDAVRKGFLKATGEILMILDADLTVAPEDLPRFYDALATNKGEFINGVRLVYPMEKGAMQFINLLGNKFFSMAFSYLLNTPIKDTLCGTKTLYKNDYDIIANNRSYFGNFDPFGDYDLIFGASRLGLKLIDLPIRYRERTYGSTNIHRWAHGWLLIKMMIFAARRIKYI